MSEHSEAAEQVVRMMLTGGEVAVKLTGSALKNGIAMLLALMRNKKKVHGKMRMTRLLRNTRDIRTFTMTPAQFKQFAMQAKRMKIMYSAVADRKKGSTIDVIMPVTEIARANSVFEKIRYTPEKTEQAQREHEKTEQEKSKKKEPPSPTNSRDTRDRSSTQKHSRTSTTIETIDTKTSENSVRDKDGSSSQRSANVGAIHERPSVEERLKQHKREQELKATPIPTRDRSRKKSRGKAK